MAMLSMGQLDWLVPDTGVAPVYTKIYQVTFRTGAPNVVFLFYTYYFTRLQLD